MSGSNNRNEGPVATDLHPAVYAILIGLVSWLIIAVWGFARDGYVDFLLAVVSGFLIMISAIPTTLWLMVRSQQEQNTERDRRSFRDWASGEFATWQDHVRGANAAVEILLPMAAIAIGMTAFAVVLHYTIPST